MTRSFRRDKAIQLAGGSPRQFYIPLSPVYIAPLPPDTLYCPRCGGRLGYRRWWGKIGHRKRLFHCKKCGEVYAIAEL